MHQIIVTHLSVKSNHVSTGSKRVDTIANCWHFSELVFAELSSIIKDADQIKKVVKGMVWHAEAAIDDFHPFITD